MEQLYALIPKTSLPQPTNSTMPEFDQPFPELGERSYSELPEPQGMLDTWTHQTRQT